MRRFPRYLRTIAGGGTLNPLTIPNLELWLDAADVTTFTVDGANKVSQWRDKSLSARHASQGTALNQPTRLSNQLNNLPAVRGYDNQWMTLSGPDLSSAAGFTIAVVGEMGSTNFEGIYVQTPASGSNNGVAIWTGSYRSGWSGGAIALPTGAPSLRPGSPFISIYRNDGTKTTANTRVFASWNAVERVSTVAQDAATPPARTAFLLADAVSSSMSDTNICEILVFSRNLSDLERTKVYNYLYDKWWPAPQAPAGISNGLTLWLDAADASTLWLDGSNNVGGWLDKSGNTRHACQATVLTRPNLIAGGLNGLPTVRTTSAGNLNLATDTYNATAFFGAARRAITRFMVWKHTAGAISSSINDGTTNNQITTNASTGGPTNWNTTSYTITPFAASSVFRVIANRFDADAQTHDSWANGVRIASQTNFIVGGMSNTNTYRVQIGASSGGADAEMAEYIVYNTALSDGDVATINTYLQNKWLPSYAPPAGVTGLQLWLDGADTTTITLDGSSNISEWRDKSGNYRHATQATALNRPSYTSSNQINSINTPWFAGVSSRLTVPHAPEISASSYTVIAVVDNDSTGTAFRSWFGKSANASPGNRKYFIGTNQNIGAPWAPSNMVVIADGESTSALGNGIKEQSGAGNSLPVIVSHQKDASVAAYLWTDGVLRATTLTPNSNNTNTSPLAIGDEYYPWLGKVAEVLYYDRVLTTPERQSVESYLRTKWMPSFTPASLSGLQLWLDAADTPTFLFDAFLNVEEWQDKSGNNRHAGQSNPADRPAYLAAQLNGLAAVKGDGVSDSLNVPSFPSLAAGYTIYVVSQSSGLTSGAVLSLNAGVFNSAIVVGNDSGSGSYVSQWGASVSQAAPAAGTDFARMIKYDGSHPTGNYRVRLTSQVADTTGAMSQVAATPPAGTMTLLRALTTYSSRNLYELIILDRQTTVAEDNNIKAYITAKWGVTWA
jgi:hypothetical protein